MKLNLQSKMKVSQELLWSNLKNTSTFLKVGAPLMKFKDLDKKGLPAYWCQGETYKLNMYIFGFIPMGHHEITFVRMDDTAKIIATDEKGQLIKSWQHTMKVLNETTDQTSVFRDELSVENGLLTFPTFIGVYLFFVYRHFRIKQLIRKGLIF